MGATLPGQLGSFLTDGGAPGAAESPDHAANLAVGGKNCPRSPSVRSTLASFGSPACSLCFTWLVFRHHLPATLHGALRKPCRMAWLDHQDSHGKTVPPAPYMTIQREGITPNSTKRDSTRGAHAPGMRLHPTRLLRSRAVRRNDHPAKQLPTSMRRITINTTSDQRESRHVRDQHNSSSACALLTLATLRKGGPSLTLSALATFEAVDQSRLPRHEEKAGAACPRHPEQATKITGGRKVLRWMACQIGRAHV